MQQLVNARALKIASWIFVVSSVAALAVMAFYFFEQRDYRLPSRLGSPLLVVAQFAFPVFGTAAAFSIFGARVVATGRRGRSFFGWLAAVCTLALLASISVGNVGGISWGESYAHIDATGINESEPLWEFPMLIAPVLAVPVLLALSTLFVSAWLGGLSKRASTEFSSGHTSTT